MSLQGLDVSNWQGDAVDWDAVAASGRSFAFVKASEDPDYLDPCFARNWRACQRVGMVRGAYHFAQPDRASPAASVTLFQRAIEAAGGLGTGDLVALDLEAGTGDLLRWAAEWLDLAERVFGVRPVLYSGHWFMQPHHLEDAGLGAYPLWLASYQDGRPPPPTGWSGLAFWQYGAHASVPGVSGDVDVNEFLGTREELLALGKPLEPLVWSPPFHVDPPAPAPAQPAARPPVPPEVLGALDVLWAYAGPDVAVQTAIVNVKVALKLQEAA